MPFLNIFSNKKEKTKKEKIKVIADNREKQSLVISELIALGIEIELKQLQIADYLVNDIAIERKTISDLQSSIINKRIISQLNDLSQYKKKFLIIEGDINYDNTIIHENALRGLLLSISLDYKTPIIFSKNEKDTARYLFILAKKTPVKESSLRESLSFKTKEEQIQFILEGFPNIGPVTAKKLIKQFKSLRAILDAKEIELQNILGKKTKEFLNLLNIK